MHDTPLDGILINDGPNGERYMQKPLGTGETGFTGDIWNPSLEFTGDDMYRSEAWLTMLAGGATFNNLDYSFSVAHPDGTDYPIPTFVPGGGGPPLRKSLGALQTLLDSLPLESCAPVRSLVTAVTMNGRPQMLAQWAALGNVSDSIGTIAFYLTSAYWANGTANGTYTLEFEVLPPASSPGLRSWHATFIDPVGGTWAAPVPVTADDYTRLSITTPPFVLDVAMVLTRDAAVAEQK